MPHRRLIRTVWRNLAVVALLLAALSSFTSLYLNAQRVSDNQQRIEEIQDSRVTSCLQTYEGIRDVFRPFFRTKSLRTTREQKNIDKFNKTVDELKSRCVSQTQPRG